MTDFITPAQELERRQAARRKKQYSAKVVNKTGLAALAGIQIKETPEMLVARLFKRLTELNMERGVILKSGKATNGIDIVIGRIRQRLCVVCANRQITNPILGRVMTKRECEIFRGKEEAGNE